MAKKRVHELAKQYDMPSAEVLKRLADAGIEGKAAASAGAGGAARRGRRWNASLPWVVRWSPIPGHGCPGAGHGCTPVRSASSEPWPAAAFSAPSEPP